MTYSDELHFYFKCNQVKPKFIIKQRDHFVVGLFFIDLFKKIILFCRVYYSGFCVLYVYHHFIINLIYIHITMQFKWNNFFLDFLFPPNYMMWTLVKSKSNLLFEQRTNEMNEKKKSSEKNEKMIMKIMLNEKYD